jgi:hypothetical protein
MVNQYEEYCIKESKYYLNRAAEAIEACRTDPKKFYDESTEHYKHLCKLFPFMLMIQYSESRGHDSETEESLSETLSSTQEDSGSFVPATPPDH